MLVTFKEDIEKSILGGRTFIIEIIGISVILTFKDYLGSLFLRQIIKLDA